jgi:Flp pilus assembly protein TadG
MRIDRPLLRTRRKTQSRGAGLRRRGAAVIEFGLVLPVLITIVLACVDFGRFAYTAIDVTNAARVGSEFGSLHPYTTGTLAQWQSDIRTLVQNEMKNTYGYSVNKLTVPNPVVTTDSDGQKRVQVSVTYPFTTIVTWPLVPHQFNIQRATQMRVIR